MRLLLNAICTIAILALAWLTFLLVSYAVSATALYALEYMKFDGWIGVLRTILGAMAFALWAAAWYFLTKNVLYKLLLKRGDQVN